jgi:hypothetical protein
VTDSADILGMWREMRLSQPNGSWHIDTSVIKLLDGTKVHLRAEEVNSVFVRGSAERVAR